MEEVNLFMQDGVPEYTTESTIQDLFEREIEKMN